MIKNIKKKLNRYLFDSSFVGFLLNPFFIARSNLYKNIKKLRPFISGKVLDVGCGKKPYKDIFLFSEYIGIDVNQDGHNHDDENIDIFYDGKKIPFSDHCFDSVISNQVLEHVFSPAEYLLEINRVLKSGGSFLISVPFIWDEHEQPYDYARYSSFGLRYLLEKSGFKIIKEIKSTDDFSLIFQLINAYVYKKLSTLRKFYIGYFLILLFIIPFNFFGFLSSLILPKNKDLYLDNIFLCQKK